jgi:ribosomal protein L13E
MERESADERADARARARLPSEQQDYSGARAARKRSGKGTRSVKSAPCPICKFKTVPPHDARKHRFAQGKNKRPFTAAELSNLGLKKV